MSEERIERRYERAFEQASALNPVFPAAAREQMAQMVETIARSQQQISDIISTNQSVPIKAGFAAETAHAEIFNLDAALNNDNSRAITDRDPEWYNHEWNGSPLGKNDIPDIAIVEDGKVITTAQSKYNNTPENTAQQMSQVHDGSPKYEGVDILLGPSDQVDPKGDIVSIKEHAEAKAEALNNAQGDPSEIKAYEQTAEKNSDVITNGKSSSKPLSKKDAEQIAAGDNTKLKEIENSYQTRSTLQQMGKAAAGAAALSAVISGSINTVRYIQQAREGKISIEDATYKIVGETVAAAADSAVKAASTTGLNSLMIRYGSRELAKEVFAKQGLKAMLRGNAMTVGVVCAIDAVKDLVRLGMGDITKEQFYERQGKGILMTSAGVVGGSMGAAGAAGMAVALGASAGSTAITVASLIGGLSGGMIAGLAMTLAIENGIEKPYRDLVNNTQNLYSAALELERLSGTVLKSQVMFTQFIQLNAQLDKAIANQFDKIDKSGQVAFADINKI